MEPAETGDPKYNTCIVDKNPDASGAASVDFPEVSDNPFVSKSGDVSSLYFRDHTYSQEPDKEQKSEEDEEEGETQHEGILCGIMGEKSSGYYYNPLLYFKRSIDKTYYYRYFKPYAYDHRVLAMPNYCQCP